MDACGGMLVRFVDTDRGVKQAASDLFPKAELERYRPPKGKFMLHVIGVAANEDYGFNKNADAFSRQDLRDYHHTFLDGHMFREHNNQDPKHAIGEIKAAGYHPTLHRVENILWGDREKAAKEYEMARAGKPISVSMACFPGGTAVRLWDGRQKPIEEVEPGDEVVTHHGRHGSVSFTMSRDYDGPGVELKVVGAPHPVRATSDHKIWVRPTVAGTHECPVCGASYQNLKAHLRQRKDVKHQAAYHNFSGYCEGFREISRLVPGDMVRLPVDTTVAGGVDMDQAWLLGLYLAEGHVHRYVKNTKKAGRSYHCHRVRLEFSLGAHERSLIQRLLATLGKFFKNSVNEFPRNDNGGTRVRVDLAADDVAQCELVEWLEYHGGIGCEKKRLSSEALRWEPECQMAVVSGWLDGDGTWSKHHWHISGTTVSETLAWHLQTLLARNRVASRLHVFYPETASRKPGYMLVVNQADVAAVPFCRKPDNCNRPSPEAVSISHLRHQAGTAAVTRKKQVAHMIVDANGHLYGRVNRVRQIHLSEKVFDLTVPGDHGFVAGGLGVSNCKIAFDVCSIQDCKNQARSPRYYCWHLKNHLGRYIPEKRAYAYADNPKPRFFDMSAVENPAERVARYLQYRFDDEGELQKAASGNRIISGADWAEYYGITPGDVVTIPLSSSRVAALRKLASVEAWMRGLLESGESPTEARAQFALAAMNAWDPEDVWSRDNIQKAAQCRPGTLFRELAKRAVSLPPASLYGYLMDVDPEVIQKSADGHGVCSLMSNLFGDALTKVDITGGLGQMGHLCDSDSQLLTSMDGNCDDKVQQAMDSAISAFSAKEEPATQRFTMIMIKSGSARPTHFKNVAVTDEMRSTAELYAAYKTAAYEDMLVMNPWMDPDKLAIMLVAQNMTLASA